MTQLGRGCGRPAVMSRLIAVTSWPLLTLTAVLAGAAPTAAEASYKKGVKLEAAGDVAAALAEFESTPAEKRDVATRVHIASCKRKLGRLLDARADLDALLATSALDESWRETIKSDLDVLDERIPVIRITSARADSTIAVDGRLVEPGVVRVNPGEHVVTATRGSERVFERRVTLAEGASVDITIDPGPAPVATPSVVAPVSAPVPSERAPSAFGHALPFFIGGVVLAGGFVVTRVMAGHAKDDVANNCLSQHALECDSAAAGGGRVRTYEALSWTSAALSLTAFAVGTVVYIKSRQTERTAWVAPTLGQYAGITLGGSF